MGHRSRRVRRIPSVIVNAVDVPICPPGWRMLRSRPVLQPPGVATSLRRSASMPRSSFVARSFGLFVFLLVAVVPHLDAQGAARTLAQGKPTVEQFLSPASPLEVTAARKSDRVAWMTYD